MSKRNTCDKCKNYTQNEWQKDSMWKNAGQCALIGYSGDFPHKVDVDKVAGYDYEGYSGGAYVGPKFGCIHWARKEAS